MSRHDPVMRFLGVPRDADELDLLGLDPGHCTPVAIDAALVSRLAMVYDHPQGRTQEGEDLRRRLRMAADHLKDPESRPVILMNHGSMPVPRTPDAVRAVSKPAQERAPGKLTPLQEQMLMTLAGCGGWNAQSRSRLASIAAMHGLSPALLVSELRSLTQQVRSGATMSPPPSRRDGRSAARSLEPGFVEHVIRRYAPELRSSDARSLVKLCILFAGIGLLGLILMLRLLLSAQPVNTNVAVGVDEPGGIVEPGVDAVGVKKPRIPIDVHVASFEVPPILSLQPLPTEVLDAVDASADTIRLLESLSRRVIGVDEVDAEILAEWTRAIEIASTGWFATDPATARGLRRAIRGVMDSAGSNPSVFTPLLDVLAPPSEADTASPLSIPRGAFKSGMVSELGSAESISPGARSRSIEMLRNSIDRGVRPGTFDAAASQWLAKRIPFLVSEIEIDPSAKDDWKFWFLSLLALEQPSMAEPALLEALAAILSTETDLARPGPSQLVLGRVLSELDWIGSTAVQDSVLALFGDENISATDLWVLTSMLATLDMTPWFDPTSIVPTESDLPHRRRLRDRIRQAWPSADAFAIRNSLGIPADFDPQPATTWLIIFERVRSLPQQRGTQLQLRELLMERLLAESASDLVMGDGQAALSILNEIESLIDEYKEADASQPSAGAGRQQVPGSLIDGQWARKYANSRTKDSKMKDIRSLEMQGGNQIGPIDADMLAQEALTASLDIRQAVHYLIENRYAMSPEMARALVDRIPGASKAMDVTELIESITGSQLPRSSSARWPMEARLALVNHALALRLEQAGETENISNAYARSLQRESERLGRVADPSSSPDAAARSLAAAWYDRLDSMQPVESTGMLEAWSNRNEARSRLAGDALQRTLAAQVGLSELLAPWMMQVMPSEAMAIEARIESVAANRDRASHVVRQMELTESGIVDLWAIRISHILELLDAAGEGAGA